MGAFASSIRTALILVEPNSIPRTALPSAISFFVISVPIINPLAAGLPCQASGSLVLYQI